MSLSSNRDKIELYVVSLWLLFLLIFIIAIDVPMCFHPECEFIGVLELLKLNPIPAVSSVLLLLGVFFFYRFKYRISGSKEIPFTVKEIKNQNFEHLTFLTTYIIPLICFDLSDVRYSVVLAVLLILIGAIYVKTDLFYANPSLALLGYHIYEITGHFRDGSTRPGLIVITHGKLKKEDKLSYRKLDDRIYFARKVPND